jgi:phosphatidylglycerophosphatase A
LAFFLGIYLCERASVDLGVHDHGGIVWDEFVGFWLTMFLIPLTWYWLLLGFLLFRFFDVIKPFPIKWLDKKVKGGFGIMIDDVLAGLFAWVILMILVRVF